LNKVGVLLAACAFLGAGAATPATAAVYDFAYTGSLSGNLTITTSDTLDAVGGFDIIGVSGTFGGSAITGLFNNPNQPNSSAGSTFTWDNVLFPSGVQAFDRYGIAFVTGIDTYNVFDAIADTSGGTLATPYGLIVASTGAETFGTGTLTAAAVPGPTVGAGASSFAMAALFLGWFVRRRAHQSA
jgi:hypothetical protein